MASLLEMVAEIVASHAGSTLLTTDQLVQEIQKVHSALLALEAGKEVEAGEKVASVITVKDAFKKNEVICMVCGKGGMKTLTRHLAKAHAMKPGEYRKQFGIPRTQSLAAKSFSEARRKMAQERGLADNLAKAREVRAAKLKAKKPAPAKPVKARGAKTKAN